MKELKWTRNEEEDSWELKVNDMITIKVCKYYDLWNVYINVFANLGANTGKSYKTIEEAKEKGLKVAKAILEY